MRGYMCREKEKKNKQHFAFSIKSNLYMNSIKSNMNIRTRGNLFADVFLYACVLRHVTYSILSVTRGSLVFPLPFLFYSSSKCLYFSVYIYPCGYMYMNPVIESKMLVTQNMQKNVEKFLNIVQNFFHRTLHWEKLERYLLYLC